VLAYDRSVAERDLSLTEWAALGLLCEGRAHGWAVAAALLPEGALGRVWTSSRPLTYRALSVLRERGYVLEVGRQAGRGGPDRKLLGVSAKGRRRFAAWRGRPVEHVRELRSELMLKLLFHERAGLDPAGLLERQRQLLVRQERAVGLRVTRSTGFDRVLDLWRLSSIRAAIRFAEDLGGLETHGAALYRPIGRVRSSWATLPGMPLQPAADESGTAELHLDAEFTEALDDLAGFSHVWVLSHLHRVGGWEPHVLPFLDTRSRGTLATRSPRHPNPLGLSLARIEAVAPPVVRVTGIDLLDGTPILDLKPYVPHFDAVPDATAGWFAGRAELIDTIRSDDRFGHGRGLEP
jgi:tRNA (adenine37-N6)-methyltransferase